MDRRTFLAAGAVFPLASSLPGAALAQPRTYAPASTAWRTFEVTTLLEIASPGGATQAWVPVPAVSSDWQQSLVEGEIAGFEDEVRTLEMKIEESLSRKNLTERLAARRTKLRDISPESIIRISSTQDGAAAP